jgi:hypothetical protein
MTLPAVPTFSQAVSFTFRKNEKSLDTEPVKTG